jgi:hypothetical protein
MKGLRYLLARDFLAGFAPRWQGPEGKSRDAPPLALWTTRDR